MFKLKYYLIFKNWLHVTTVIYIVYILSLNNRSFKAIAGCPPDSSSSRTAR